MGTITGTAIVASASEVVRDPSNVEWTTANGLGWINDGQRAICVARPDASATVVDLTLVAGTKQSITGRRLLSIIRNMGADGATPGNGIRQVNRDVMDEYDPTWHTADTATTVQEYMYDSRFPTIFYVSPPVPASPVVHIEAIQSVTPTDLNALADPITLDDVYAPVLIEWVLYRFFGRDHETTANGQRAMRHLENFYKLLGVKTQADGAADAAIPVDKQ